jgi:hypothetical protein
VPVFPATASKDTRHGEITAMSGAEQRRHQNQNGQDGTAIYNIHQ